MRRGSFMEFEKYYEQVEYVISLAIHKCRIYKNKEHYEQVGREAIWQAFQRFTGKEEEFAPYAYVYVRNAILNELRKSARKENREVLIESHEVMESFQQDSRAQELSDVVEKLLTPLKEEDRKLLYWLYVEQYSYEETSKLLQISVHALKKRRDRLMSNLRSRKNEVFNEMLPPTNHNSPK